MAWSGFPTSRDMIQRIQTIYLLAAFCLCIGCLCMPIAHFMPVQADGPVDMYNLWLVSEEGGHLFYFCPVLMGILVLVATAVFLDVWLYRRRTLQMRVATLAMILLVCWCIAYGILCHMLTAELEASWRPHWTAALPPVSLILTYLAFRGILRDEMLVRSLDRLR